ncbi:MAG: ADP-ribosylglycohydrolase family protein [Myxococcota bacterium]|nr:ADP-ribosylglycohydrolase family protein [Myxococcota bacterium]
MTEIPSHRAIGAFLGLAAGDAYGRPLEFITGLKVRQARVSTTPHDFMWTDDTHMSLYLADALLSVASQNFSPNALGEAIGQAFSKWYEDPLTPSTAPGNTCLEGVKNFIESGNWETCGIQNSDGCGAVMRLCPLPLVYSGDTLDVAASISAQVTHAHPNAIAATVVGARLLRSVLEKGELNPQMVLDAAAAIELSHPKGVDVPAALRAAVMHSQMDNVEWLDEDFIPPGDGGWRSPSALGLALAAALIWKNNPARAIEKAARINGDSDSVACLTGMYLGATHGVEALPAEWLNAIPMRRDIEQKVHKLLNIHEHAQAPSLATQLNRIVDAGVQVLPDPDRLRNAILFALPYGHPVGEEFDHIAKTLGITVHHGAAAKLMAIDRALVPASVRRKIGKTHSTENTPEPFSSGGRAEVIEEVEDAEIIEDVEVMPFEPQSQSTPIQSHIRTSVSDPIKVDWIKHNIGPGRGSLGVTFAPGKQGSSSLGKPWNRNLDMDLCRLKGRFNVDVLMSLVEDKELQMLRISDLVSRAAEHRIAVCRYPIVDQLVPKIDAAQHAVDVAVALLNAGQNVVFHCRGGLGRAGTLSACTLVKLGEHPAKAIDTIRQHRPGAIENSAQEKFVHRFAIALGQ